MSAMTQSTRARASSTDLRPDEDQFKILLVEAREAIAQVVVKMLESATRGHFSIGCAHDLFEVLHRPDIAQFDLLLVDLALPGGDRIATLELASELAHRFPVVVLTGTETCNDMRPLGSGAVGVDEDRRAVARSLQRSDLCGKIVTAIRRHRRLGPAPEGPGFCRLGYAGEPA